MENREDLDTAQEFELDTIQFKGFEYFDIGSDEPEELDFNHIGR
jgi:hypothetical protein